jgi:hypothetical protein
VNVYPFIEPEQAGKHNVKRACELLEASRSAYYQQQHGVQSYRSAAATSVQRRSILGGRKRRKHP